MFTLSFALAASTPFARAHTAEDCGAFTWDLSREFAAMRSPAIALAAGLGPKRVELGKHYSAKLLPQDSVSFRQPPSRPARSAQPMAGLFSFTTRQAGRYRIGLTTGHWVDVLDGTTVINSTSHQGRSGCALLHKVVEFELPANRTLTLQLSGQEAAVVDMIVSPA
jgi:hypothetical protein